MTTNLISDATDVSAVQNKRRSEFTNLLLTIYTAAIPTRLTKVFSIAADGSLKKVTAATMHAGIARRHAVDGLQELASLLEGLASNQAVSWGVCTASEVAIVQQEDDDGRDPTKVARTRRNFAYPKGPGVMMLDHDGIPDGALDADQLRQKLIQACPALATAPMLWRPSASAGLVAANGDVLTGLHRHRLYIPVLDASAIPEAGKRLVRLLWAAGFGWHEVGKAGQALERSLVDASVWQPEHLDFAAPPVLEDGVCRPAVVARIFGDGAALFDLSLISSATEEKEALGRLQHSRKAVAAKCSVQREVWATHQIPALARRRGISPEKARQVLVRASEHLMLMGDFVLTAADGTSVSVGEVLDNADRWHNARFADPLDPDEDLRVAVVNLKSGACHRLYTHRHGGLSFELMRPSARVQIGRGMRIASTDAVLQVLRDRQELYDFGDGAVVYVTGGRPRPASQEWLTDRMGRVCEFYTVRTRKDADGMPEQHEVADDAPSAVARAVLAKHGERGLKKLVAVVTAPTLRPDGSVLDIPGHDAESGLLYFSDEPNPPRVPDAPTLADALTALRFLWAPFAEFPMVDSVARGVLLQGLLTAAIRAALPTAPGVAFDAPAAGTGKTLLARAIGILATGEEPSIMPPADAEEETRKRLFAALRDGCRVLLWDNVGDSLGGDALNAFLTAATFSDRVLGASETVSLPNRMLFVATGNNLRLRGDTCRRVLVARIDARSERPSTRTFGFAPAQRILAQRSRYVVAALTIIRAHITAGRPNCGEGRSASFELWDDLVRQPICWLRQQMTVENAAGLPEFDDPLEATAQAYEQDPETARLKALLHAWHTTFPNQPATVAKAVRASTGSEALHAILDDIGGRGASISSRSVGRWIERYAGRPIGGLHFEHGTMSSGIQQWIVKQDALAPGNKPTKDTKPTSTCTPVGVDGDSLGGFGGFGGLIPASFDAQAAVLAALEPTESGMPVRSHLNGHNAGATNGLQ